MKKPTQKRSRERVNVILKTATAIIAHSGSEGLQMNDLARAAKVPIGSLYQYFPSKQSVVLALVDRFLGRVREQIELAFEEIRDRETAIQVIKATIWNYYQTCLKEPAIRDIWCYSQSDRQLQMIDLKDTRRNAALVFIALAPYALPERHGTQDPLHAEHGINRRHNKTCSCLHKRGRRCTR